jgi:D-serine deaminase-like pyridoxal phosphate-dependent protein
MDATTYALADPAAVFSPALLFYPELIARNIRRVIELAGSPERLRPHVKTHKTREIARMELEAGVTKHKCATVAEAELLAGAGARDVLLAYPLVGPNCGRLARLAAAFPDCRFRTTADHPAGVRGLSDAARAAGVTIDVLLDLDVGQHRTGVPVGSAAAELYEEVARSPGLTAGGLHAYDGHNHQTDRAERESAVRSLLGPVLELRSALEAKGLPVLRVVAGGTPTFPVFAGLRDVPGLECSPGTFALHDAGYGGRFPDLTGLTPAAVLLTRVVSRPTPTRVTFDLGTKAVASDPPAGQRVTLLGVPDAKAVAHNEEHLVVETPAADRFAPGDVAYAVPTHICPTVALHRSAVVVEGGRVTGRWEVVGRDRQLRF